MGSFHSKELELTSHPEPTFFTENKLVGTKTLYKTLDCIISHEIKEGKITNKQRICFPPQRSLLVHGPRGSGKASATIQWCNENSIPCYEYKPHKSPPEDTPAVVLVRCIDSLLSDRNTHNAIAKHLLDLIDQTKKENDTTRARWYIITCDLCPWELPQRLRNIFTLSAYVEPPKKSERREALRILLDLFCSETNEGVETFTEEQSEKLLNASRGFVFLEILAYAQVVFADWMLEKTSFPERDSSFPLKWAHFSKRLKSTHSTSGRVSIGDIDAVSRDAQHRSYPYIKIDEIGDDDEAGQSNELHLLEHITNKGKRPLENGKEVSVSKKNRS